MIEPLSSLMNAGQANLSPQSMQQAQSHAAQQWSAKGLQNAAYLRIEPNYGAQNVQPQQLATLVFSGVDSGVDLRFVPSPEERQRLNDIQAAQEADRASLREAWQEVDAICAEVVAQFRADDEEAMEEVDAIAPGWKE